MNKKDFTIPLIYNTMNCQSCLGLDSNIIISPFSKVVRDFQVYNDANCVCGLYQHPCLSCLGKTEALPSMRMSQYSSFNNFNNVRL
jgi:hypothetical protein